MTVLNSTIWTSFLQQDRDAMVLDVRSPEEWEKGVLFNAMTIDVYDSTGFDAVLKTLDKNKHYYIYSQFGAKGEITCAKMEEQGFTETMNLDKGLIGYYLSCDRPIALKKKIA